VNAIMMSISLPRWYGATSLPDEAPPATSGEFERMPLPSFLPRQRSERSEKRRREAEKIQYERAIRGDWIQGDG